MKLDLVERGGVVRHFFPYAAVARARDPVHLPIRNSSTHSKNGIGIDHVAIYLSKLTLESMRQTGSDTERKYWRLDSHARQD
jgi:hypothetical protein